MGVLRPAGPVRLVWSWGGDVDEALDGLSRVLVGEGQAELPATLPRERAAIRRWLEERVDVPVLEGVLLFRYVEESPAPAGRQC